MSEESLQKSIDNLTASLDKYSKCMQEIHITMFGVDGRGGCLQRQEKHIEEYAKFRFRVTLLLVATATGTGSAGFGAGMAISKALLGG